MRTITLEKDFACTPRDLFDALHTPSALRSWWNADRVIIIPRKNGIFAAAWGENEDDPEYMSSGIYKVYEPPYRSVTEDFRYYAKSDPVDFEDLMSIAYEITPSTAGAHLSLTHAGFPDESYADAHFDACVEGWAASLKSLRSHLEDPDKP